MKKKKLRVKKKVIRFLLLVILISIGITFGNKQYKLYKYHQTDEYKLLTLKYDKETVYLLLDKLDKTKITELINKEKIDYIQNIVSAKYYLDKNYYKYLEYYELNKDKSFDDVIAIVNVGATTNWYEDAKKTDTLKGIKMLTNKFNLLPEDYVANDLEYFTREYTFEDVSAKKEVYDAFLNMATAAKTDGIHLMITSGYRTYEEQKETFDSLAMTYGTLYAERQAARPGASEHETGLALDILSLDSQYIESFHTSKAYKWLIKNAVNYGFILRYPEGKEYITGFEPESWHYRYLGKELAKKVEDSGLTYDEYYAYYIDK